MVRRFHLALILLLTLSISALSCGGSGDGGINSSGSGDLGGNSRIEGTIEDLVVAKSDIEPKDSLFLDIRRFFDFVVEANAQEGALCGIKVMLIQDGEVVAVTETDCDGNFVFENVIAGEKLLMFETDQFTQTIEIIVPENGTTKIMVSLNGEDDNQVVINEIINIIEPIDCDNGVIEIGNPELDEIEINGDGGDCIKVEGDCEVILNAQNIEFNDCSSCISADGTSVVTVNADGKIECDSEDGVSSDGDSDVSFDAEECLIKSDKEPVREFQQGRVDLENCEEIEMDEEPEEPNDEKDNPVCEIDCVGDDCDLFCNDLVSDDCVELCSSASAEVSCLEECLGSVCEADCEEFCKEEVEECVRTEVEQVCDEVCVQTEEVCEEFCKKEGCIEFGEECDEKCVQFGLECDVIEGEEVCEEVCIEEGVICEPVCVEDGCIEFGEECGEKCVESALECEDKEVCVEGDVTCVEEGVSCRIECE